MTTLAAIQTEIAEVRAALSAAYKAQSYGQGDRSLTRANILDLEGRLSRLIRTETELTAHAAGAKNAGVVTPRWS